MKKDTKTRSASLTRSQSARPVSSQKSSPRQKPQDLLKSKPQRKKTTRNLMDRLEVALTKLKPLQSKLNTKGARNVTENSEVQTDKTISTKNELQSLRSQIYALKEENIKKDRKLRQADDEFTRLNQDFIGLKTRNQQLETRLRREATHRMEAQRKLRKVHLLQTQNRALKQQIQEMRGQFQKFKLEFSILQHLLEDKSPSDD